MMNVPLGNLAQLGKTAGWRKLFGQYSDELGDAFVEGPVKAMIRPSALPSRGFAGTSYRNPMQPDFAAAGPKVRYGSAAVKTKERPQYVGVRGRDEAQEVQKAIQAEHVDNSSFAKLKRLLGTSEGRLGAAGLGGLAAGGIGGAMMAGGDEIDPELLMLLRSRGLA